MRTTSGKDWIRESTRQAIYHRDGDACVACDGGPLSLDHVDPCGGNGCGNLITLCKTCNSSKGERTFQRWRPELMRKVRRHLARKLDRAEGLRRAKILRPSRYAQESFRQSKEGRKLAADRRAERDRSVAEMISGQGFRDSFNSIEVFFGADRRPLGIAFDGPNGRELIEVPAGC